MVSGGPWEDAYALSVSQAGALAGIGVVVGFAAAAGLTRLMSALLFWRHRSNIRKLLDGTEDKIGEKPA